jgi:hypothetical protein
LCTRNGCGKQYTNEENNEHACFFHPGVPVFHEGLKGWSCCSKKVIDFDEFMNLPGCASGAHTDLDNKPKEVPKQQATDVKLVSTGATEVYKTNEQPVTKGYTNVPIQKKETPPPKKEEEVSLILFIGSLQ